MSELRPETVRRIRELRYNHGLTYEQTAVAAGCSTWAVWRYAPGRPGKVPNDKLRAAFEASHKTAVDVARALDWVNGRTADVSRVRRALGLYDDINGRGLRSRRRYIDAETAGLLAEALGLMPWEVMPDDQDVAA